MSKSLLEDEEDQGIPGWIVTYGDMMSLLLTFFIMIVAMSEIRQERRFQAMIESLRRRFGHDTSMATPMPGPERPMNSPLAKLASLGRSRRADTMEGGDRVQAPLGENPRVQTIRPADDQTVGGVVYFPGHGAELTDEHQAVLRAAAERLRGKPQKIEIRGHTSSRPLTADSPFQSHWDLAYARCLQVMEALVEMGIERRRFRLAVAAQNEPVHLGSDPIRERENSRVDVSMLNELTDDLTGTAEDKARRIAP